MVSVDVKHHVYLLCSTLKIERAELPLEDTTVKIPLTANALPASAAASAADAGSALVVSVTVSNLFRDTIKCACFETILRTCG